MKVYLVRHGIAQERLGGAILNDSQRPLTDEGKSEMKQVGHALKRLNVKPDVIVSSPLVRAKQTAEIIRDVLNFEDELKITDTLAPGGSPSSVYKYLKQFAHVDEIFLVGHEPDIGMLVSNMLWAAADVHFPFKKGAVCRVDVYDLPATSPGVMKWFMTPKMAKLIS
ncbi:MAG: phosphohistidine phosphatase SixA [Candidatus Melainabacteria bacterium]|nr:MAG: phosphohistidine phosphatase SixA [Candidatus Melainabacteria bacterium]